MPIRRFRPYRQEVTKMCNHLSKSSEEANSQSKNKKVSETKSLKKLKGYTNRIEVEGVDITKAGITLTPDVLDYCKANNFRIVGRAIYFNSCGVM
jgi:hypothetical protein